MNRSSMFCEYEDRELTDVINVEGVAESGGNISVSISVELFSF